MFPLVAFTIQKSNPLRAPPLLPRPAFMNNLRMPGFFADTPMTLNPLEEARRRRVALGLPLVDLTQNNPTHCGWHFPAEALIEAASRHLAGRRYDPDPRGLPAARSAIRRYYAARTPALDVPEERIFITASTSEAYRLLFTLLCDPGDNLLAPDVTYPLFDLFAEDKSLQLKPYRSVEARGWDIDGGSIVAAADPQSRGILLISPHNPTGCIQRRTYTEIASAGLPLIADEVFAEFVHDGGGCPPLAALYPELPVFHLNGISKMFALPDLKVGWIALNAPAYEQFGERLELLNDAYLSASSLSQAMLPAIFAAGAPFQRAMVQQVTENVRFAVGRLSAAEGVDMQPPQGGTFLLAKVRDDVDEEALALTLLESGVLVHPGYFYGCAEGAHLMISCLMPRKILAEGLERVIEGLRVALMRQK